jgi:hypothetical protein
LFLTKEVHDFFPRETQKFDKKPNTGIRNSFLASTIAVMLCQIASLKAQSYSIASAELKHEGTWLQWPEHTKQTLIIPRIQAIG